MKKQFLFLAIALSFVSFGANASSAESSKCPEGRISCCSGMSCECVQPNPVTGGCPG